MQRLSPAVLLLAVLAAGCGYVMAGTWVDDSGNWSRAFASTKPPDVTVVHSKYWRSPHWSVEFAYFFEIAPSPALTQQLFSKNELRQITGADAAAARKNIFGPAPDWFAPKASTEYDVWVFASEPLRNFTVLIDKKSGVVFLTDYQV